MIGNDSLFKPLSFMQVSKAGEVTPGTGHSGRFQLFSLRVSGGIPIVNRTDPSHHFREVFLVRFVEGSDLGRVDVENRQYRRRIPNDGEDDFRFRFRGAGNVVLHFRNVFDQED